MKFGDMELGKIYIGEYSPIYFLLNNSNSKKLLVFVVSGKNKIMLVPDTYPLQNGTEISDSNSRRKCIDALFKYENISYKIWNLINR